MIRRGDKLPVGVDSFRCLVLEKYTFVDKTLLIYEFITASDKVSLILRPRRFGKSMNLDMLRYFFELVPAETPGTCNRRELFKDLLIETQHPELFESHFAKYPCIYLSLKDFKMTSWSGMLLKIANKISDLFDIHSYLLDTLKGNDARKFKSIINREDDYTEESLKFLSQLLTKYHKSRCIVLIDEYDAPLECAYNRDNDNPNHEGYEFLIKAKSFFGTLFSSLLKTNDNGIYKALLVGVLRVAKSGYLSDLNNLSVYPMFESRYSDKFGFIDDEVQDILSYQEIKTSVKDIASWYDSYTAGKNVKLYNPWSIIRICDLKELKSYWVETGSTSSIKELIWRANIKVQQKVDQFIKGESMEINIRHDISYETLRTSSELSLWSLLYYAGYLTIRKVDENVAMMEDDEDLTDHTTDNDSYLARIPNHEVLKEWKGWFSTLLYTEDKTDSLLDLLLAGKGSEFCSLFPSALQSSLSYFDVGGKKSGKNAESFYHAFCLGLFIHARSRSCEVKSNYIAGQGRWDVSIYPRKNLNHYAVIFEFKVVYDKKKEGDEDDYEEDEEARSGSSQGDFDGGVGGLAESAAVALQQIETTNYGAGIPQNISKLLELGVAFKGNSSHVQFKELAKVDNGWGVVAASK